MGTVDALGQQGEKGFANAVGAPFQATYADGMQIQLPVAAEGEEVSGLQQAYRGLEAGRAQQKTPGFGQRQPVGRRQPLLQLDQHRATLFGGKEKRQAVAFNIAVFQRYGRKGRSPFAVFGADGGHGRPVGVLSRSRRGPGGQLYGAEAAQDLGGSDAQAGMDFQPHDAIQIPVIGAGDVHGFDVEQAGAAGDGKTAFRGFLPEERAGTVAAGGKGGQAVQSDAPPRVVFGQRGDGGRHQCLIPVFIPDDAGAIKAQAAARRGGGHAEPRLHLCWIRGPDEMQRHGNGMASPGGGVRPERFLADTHRLRTGRIGELCRAEAHGIRQRQIGQRDVIACGRFQGCFRMEAQEVRRLPAPDARHSGPHRDAVHGAPGHPRRGGGATRQPVLAIGGAALFLVDGEKDAEALVPDIPVRRTRRRQTEGGVRRSGGNAHTQKQRKRQ